MDLRSGKVNKVNVDQLFDVAWVFAMEGNFVATMMLTWFYQQVKERK